MEQAGAELYLAQFKLGQARPALTDVDVVFPVFNKKLRSSSIYQKI